jgi:uncharacterized protein (TIGR03437 family)
MNEGDYNWYSVRSAPLTETINRAPTMTVLRGTTAPAQTTLTATVTPVPAGGSIQFADAATSAVLATVTLASGSASATLPAASVNSVFGHPITALYSGDTNFAASTSDPIGVPAVANAAGAVSTDFAPEEIVSMYGFDLAIPGHTITVTVTDSAGTTWPAYPLYLVSPTQINFVMPATIAPGKAFVGLTGLTKAIPIEINVASVAPGLFAAVRGGTSDSPYLILYGTGIRNRSSLAAVTCNTGARDLPVTYAGPQTQYQGLDQVNVALPQGVDAATVTLKVDGRVSNTVQVR